MTIREIYAFYGLRPSQYRYLEEIANHPGISNDQLARQLSVSPQIAGRITRHLANHDLIVDKLADHPYHRRAWYVSDAQEPLGSVRELLGMIHEDRRF